MESIRNFFITISAVALLALTAIFTMFISLFALSIVFVVGTTRMILRHFKPQTVAQQSKQQPDMRIWNDGKGKIIDL